MKSHAASMQFWVDPRRGGREESEDDRGRGCQSGRPFHPTCADEPDPDSAMHENYRWENHQWVPKDKRTDIP
jgi:hypothetical protein